MIAEPHKLKTICKVDFTSFNDKLDVLKEASFNTFKIHSDKVPFNMTSQGAGAMSQDQLSGLLLVTKPMPEAVTSISCRKLYKRHLDLILYALRTTLKVRISLSQ